MARRLYIEYLGDSIELGLGETIVGRDVGCALRFNDPSVSRRHLRFVHRANDMFVEDVGSSNGTLVNGRVLRGPMRIDEGDVLVVGSRTLTVRLTDGDEQLMPSTLILGETGPVAEFRGDEKAARTPTSQFAGVARTTSAPTVPPFATTPLERRRHDRVPVALRLVYVSDDIEIEANTTDLSQSGVFVCTQILDPVGTACELTILIDGGPALKVKGVVRRVIEQGNERGEPPGLGVELCDLGDQERAWIDIAAVRITS